MHTPASLSNGNKDIQEVLERQSTRKSSIGITGTYSDPRQSKQLPSIPTSEGNTSLPNRATRRNFGFIPETSVDITGADSDPQQSERLSSLPTLEEDTSLPKTTTRHEFVPLPEISDNVTRTDLNPWHTEQLSSLPTPEDDPSLPNTPTRRRSGILPEISTHISGADSEPQESEQSSSLPIREDEMSPQRTPTRRNFRILPEMPTRISGTDSEPQQNEQSSSLPIHEDEMTPQRTPTRLNFGYKSLNASMLRLPEIPPTGNLSTEWNPFQDWQRSSLALHAPSPLPSTPNSNRSLLYPQPAPSSRRRLDYQTVSSPQWQAPSRRLSSVSEDYQIAPETPASLDSPSSRATLGFDDSATPAVISPFTTRSRVENQTVSPSRPEFSRKITPIPDTYTAQNNQVIIGQQLRQEIESWGDLVPNKWERFVVFQPLRNRSPRDLAKSRRDLEEACAKKRIMEVRPFQVYGTPEFFQYDRLKAWVLLNQHLHDKDWPTGYVAMTPAEDLHDNKEDDKESNATFY
ncbi:MAG: hypothetical protein Q9201_007951 [Fulgogasparrea decipioides]